jgi:putative membrane protein
LLAWIRTGLAMMGFGFVVARFGLFLREFQTIHPDDAPQTVHGSQWFGTALVFLGVVVNIAAAVQHVRLVKRLEQGEWRPGPSKAGLASAIFLAAMGLAIAAYLLIIR